MTPLHWIDPDAAPTAFPPPHNALTEPNGLLAAGGDLSCARILAAYRRGIFPWFSPNEPILWWSPDPRMILIPAELHVSRNLHKTLRRGTFNITVNRAFTQVLTECAAPRGDDAGTWLGRDMQQAYLALHHSGHAHSVEVWHDGVLAGGLYGLLLGDVFFGESMFSRRADASKVALAYLCAQPVALIDCQVESEHLYSMGARPVSRKTFLDSLDLHCAAAYNETALEQGLFTWPRDR